MIYWQNRWEGKESSKGWDMQTYMDGAGNTT